MSEFARSIQKLAGTYGLRCVYSFGSRAGEILGLVQGNFSEPDSIASDIDIGVLGRAPLKLDEKVAIARALEDLFQVPRVDVVDLGTASTFLCLDVVCGELLYAADPDDESEFQLYILRKAADLAPFERKRREKFLEPSL